MGPVAESWLVFGPDGSICRQQPHAQLFPVHVRNILHSPNQRSWGTRHATVTISRIGRGSANGECSSQGASPVDSTAGSKTQAKNVLEAREPPAESNPTPKLDQGPISLVVASKRKRSLARELEVSETRRLASPDVGRRRCGPTADLDWAGGDTSCRRLTSHSHKPILVRMANIQPRYYVLPTIPRCPPRTGLAPGVPQVFSP